MRSTTALGLSLALALAGCAGPSWGFTGVALGMRFDEPLDKDVARSARSAIGLFVVEGTHVQVVAAKNGTETVLLTQLDAGGFRFVASLDVIEGGLSEEEARARVARIRGEWEPDAMALLAGFEAQTGWTHEGSVEWHEGVLHGD